MLNHPNRNQKVLDPRIEKKAKLEIAMKAVFAKGATRDEVESLMVATLRGFNSNYDDAPLSWTKVHQLMDRCMKAA